ncbi:MAG: TlpA disulfide reductase family protein [Gemmatimonadota bacterium]
MQLPALAGLLLVLGSPGAVVAQGPPVGEPAPNLRLQDLDGRPYDLSRVLGRKPVLIEFWATWCPLCQELFPQIRAAADRYGDAVEFLGVNVTVSQTREMVRQYVEEHQAPFRVLWDDEGEGVRAYDVTGTSLVVIVDREGKVAYTGYGESQDLEGALRRVASPVAQGTVRAFAMGDPRPGTEAPAFVLPYVRAGGPGPADQPFALRAELGRVVVLAIVPDPSDSAAVVLLRSFTTNQEMLFPGDVVVVAAVPRGVGAAGELARNLALSYKVLADQADQVRRLFGIDRRDLGVYVISPSGRVVWRDTRFRPMESRSYAAVRDAVRAAWAQSEGR